MAERLYHRTAAGRRAAEHATAMPSDYRRLLGLIESDTHFDVIRGCLRQYPDALLEEWLGELEQLGYVESSPSEAALDLDFTAYFKQAAPSAPPVLAPDVQRLEQTAREAGAALTRGGVFLARERLKNRPALGKRPEQTTVLIVEDDPDQVALAKLRLGMVGFKLRIARSGAEFVAEIRGQARPDVVLLDVMLPDASGFDLLAKIRHHRKLALLPVVLLTAKTDPGDIRRGLALGADAYVPKPYSKNALTDAIGQVLKLG